MAVTIDITANTSQATQAATQLSANLSAAFSGMQNQLKQMESASSHSSAAMVQGLDTISQATKATARATQIMAQDMSKSFKSVETAQKSTVDGFTLMQGAIRKTTALLATIGVSVGLTGLVKDMVEVASTFETLDVRLRFLTNSVEEFNKARQFILEFAQTTPLQLDEVSDAFIRLTSSGLDATKMLPVLVDAVSAFGGGNESLQSLIRNLQQMSTQAKVSGEELRDIARGSLIPAFQIVAEEARKMGKTVGDSLAEAGISGPKAIELLLKGMQERFKGSTLIMATTWSVLVSNLVDQWKIFSDTVIRESGFLNFMKAAASELFTLMQSLIQGNKTEFAAWGDAAVAAMRKASLSVASLLDLLNGVLQLGARVQAQFAEWERQGAEVMANLYNSVAQFFGFTGNFTAKVQGDIAQATGAVVSAITSGEITAAVEQTFERLKQKAEEFRKIQEGIQGKQQKFQQPAATETGGSQAAANRLKAEEEQLKASLKRQEALIGASYDERRQLIDAQAAEALAQDVTNVNAIAHARTQALRTAAIEEARDLERVRLESVDRQLAKSQEQIKAEIAAHAGKPAQIAKYEAELTTVIDESEAQRAKIREQTAQVEQQNSRKSVEQQIKSAQELVKLTETMEQDRLKARIDLSDEQIALVQSQVDGEVLTQRQGMERIHALQNQRLANTADLYRREADAAIAAIDLEVRETDAGYAQVAKIHQDLDLKLQALGVQRQTQQQEQLNELTKGWREWTKDVRSALGDFLSRWANGETNLIKDSLDRLKSYFFQVIADMVAKAAVTSIVIPIVMSVLGGAGGGGGGGGIGSGLLGGLGKILGLGGMGGTGGTGGGLLDMLGLAGSASQLGSMFGATSPLSSAVSFLTDRLLEAGSTVSTYFGGPALGTGFSGVTVGGAVDILPILGGAAALGAGIYGALKATNTASKAAFAASAAAGAAALASTALVAAGVIAASTGWTGIGLIAAGVTAILGTIAEMVIKPAGPSLSVRAGGGLGIGTADGKLRVEGDLASRTTRREGVDRAMAQDVQQRLEAGITAAVIGVVDTINAVALDPTALVGPTQAALQDALKRLQPINTANAKKMEKDIAEQLRFANVAIIGGLLEPLNLAFDQLRDQGDASQQLERLPGTVAGLVAVFKTMNEQLAEIATSENTDVKRQLSGVRNQVENFGNRIAGTAGQIAEQIVTGIVDTFRVNVDTELAAQITQFSGLMTTSIRALGFLRNTRDTLAGAGLGGEAVGGQIDRLAQATSEMSARISTEIVSGALAGLAADLNTVLIQPIRIQATTVNALFTDSLAAIQALWDAWHALEGAGLDASGVQQQFTKLLTGLIETTFTVIRESFGAGEFADFLSILVQLPPALVALNPVLAQVQNLGKAFASVVGPINQVIETQQHELRTTQERMAMTAATMAGLRDAIADAGTSAEKAVPLYAKLAEQIQANAQAQIDAATEAAQTQIDAVNASTDAQIKAINDVTDAQIKGTNEYIDAYIQLIHDIADAQLKAINEEADRQRDAVNQGAEVLRQMLATWVDAMTEAVNTWANSAMTTAQQLRDVQDTILAEQSPEVQRQALLEREGNLAAVVAGAGPGSPAAMSELIDTEKRLLALAQQGKDLKAQEDALKKLAIVEKYLKDQLVAMTGQSDPVLAQIAIAETSKQYLKDIQEVNRLVGAYLETTQHDQLERIAIAQEVATLNVEAGRQHMISVLEQSRDLTVLTLEATRERMVGALELSRTTMIQAIEDQRDAVVRAIKEDMVYQLQLVQYELQKLFAIQYKALTGQDLPPPVAPTRPVAPPSRPGMQTSQQGGLMGIPSGAYYAQGGMVRAMLEPGESHWTGYTAQQGRALLQMNQAFPRFAQGGMVPGTGSGDKVPMYLPTPSIVVNRNGTNALRGQGFQGGGVVQGGTNTTVHNYHYHFPNLTIRSQSDLEDLKRALTELKRRGMTRE